MGGKIVCVTGGSGYIASWLVKFLLQRGYTVKAFVYVPNDSKKTDHLLKLDGAKERLHLFKANLLEEGSFDAAVEGCEGVFHTASPFYHKVIDPHKSPEGKKMLQGRMTLPVFRRKGCSKKLLRIRETGCGKTTQLPQYILESEIEYGLEESLPWLLQKEFLLICRELALDAVGYLNMGSFQLDVYCNHRNGCWSWNLCIIVVVCCQNEDIADIGSLEES
ncbi:cinnamoyl-CoA reductase 1-like protein [Tanacetum coccineum]|uniref:Cinnamoyl-CoA reductase 1-like protein n=1 Tax=Tanacetum coccineum TaxID=301880 RepID=A0ABQ5IV90_9ASTR